MIPSKKVRVLVVDDSAFARKVLREILSAHHDIEVVGVARDGLEALERVAELRPDVMTLDLVMPGLDGIGVLAALDRERAPRVVVVSTSDDESELGVLALQHGAIDLVHKPTALATERLFELSGELCRKVLVAASAAIRPVRPSVPPSVPPTSVRARGLGDVQVVAIGTSTGGPQALSRLVPELPADLPVPVLIALHIPDGYTEALARRLNEASRVTVVEASQMPRALTPGLVVLARGGAQLTVVRQAGQAMAVVDNAPVHLPHAPSVDHLFDAVAREYGAGALGVVLTGMGDDGLGGARSIRAAGGSVLVESEASCIVYGMPRSVADAGLASAEATLDAMTLAILARL